MTPRKPSWHSEFSTTEVIDAERKAFEKLDKYDKEAINLATNALMNIRGLGKDGARELLAAIGIKMVLSDEKKYRKNNATWYEILSSM